MQYFQKRVKSFQYAIAGIKDLFKTQPNAQIHLVAVAVIVGMGLFLGLQTWEWCCIVMCIAMVLMAEAVNTAIEYLTDLASPDFHPLAGKAKDVAAGSVLLAVGVCGIVWGLIYIPKIILLFK